jgi:hypothetical protein
MMLVKGQRWSELRFVPPHVRSIIFSLYIYIYIYIYAQLFTSSLTALEDSEIYSFMLIKKQKVILLILLFEKNALDQLF